jgi:membrane fusion protein, copper/silver efflux system
MKSFIILLVGAALGLMGLTIYQSTISEQQQDDSSIAVEQKPEPLYWVAPMDPNYRRDKPGKSPMGMDLVPVYPESTADADESIVSISAAVENNLGVRTAMAMPRHLSASIKTVGYVKYNEDKLVHLHPRVEGWVEKLYITAEGDPVKKGQAVYELYSPQLVNAQQEFIQALRSSNKRLIFAAEERLKALQISDGFIKQLKTDKQVRQRVTFYAPQSGVVVNLNIREGFFVMPGTTLMSIGSLDEVWVEAEVFERQGASVAVGLPVSMTLDYVPNRTWQGQVDYIYPSLNAESRTLKLRLRFDNGDSLLKPNMFVQVVIEQPNHEANLVIPRSALIRTGAQDRVVLSLGDGKFKSVLVEVGRVTEQFVEILAGLKEHQMVVTSAQFLLDSESASGAEFQRLESDQAPEVDHSQMDHSQMDHSQMNHGDNS